jgi:cytochrome d ubiquinol oxidase subunit II
VLKADGALREWAYRRIGWLLLGTVLLVAVAFLLTLGQRLRVQDAWAARHWLLIFPVLGVLAVGGILAGVRLRRDELPFRATAALFVVAFACLAGSFWPYMIPYSLTIEQAAAPLASLEFLFYGAGLVVFPVVLAYTVGVYSIFKGKLGDGDA